MIGYLALDEKFVEVGTQEKKSYTFILITFKNCNSKHFFLLFCFGLRKIALNISVLTYVFLSQIEQLQYTIHTEGEGKATDI